LLGDLSEKFKSFGWNTLEVEGHNHDDLIKNLNLKHQNKPTAIIANTIKGKGIKVMENNPAWHHKTPTELELKEMLQEL
jgi:transketolase